MLDVASYVAASGRLSEMEESKYWYVAFTLSMSAAFDLAQSTRSEPLGLYLGMLLRAAVTFMGRRARVNFVSC